MCMYTRNTAPMIAHQDIPVLKYLDKRGDRFETPYQNTPVEFGKKMVAEPESTTSWDKGGADNYGRQIYLIGAGVIHARLVPTGNITPYCKKAIIPKGTEFWMDPFGNDIAAKAMVITDESIDTDYWSMPEILVQLILKSAPESNGIHVGDYQLTDDSFVSPSADLPKAKVRGQVCGFYKDGSPIICGLERLVATWDKNCRKLGKQYSTYEEAWQAFNGREVTAEYRKQYAEDKEFEAFHLCSTYRKEHDEEWFFGALGEVAAMLDNSLYLNAARAVTGLGYYITGEHWYWYWSCSGYDGLGSFCCYLGYSMVYRDWGYKGCRGSVVPFFASRREKKTTRVTKSKISQYATRLCNLFKRH